MLASAAFHEELNRPAIQRLGLYLFFASESFLFAALLMGRFFLVSVPDSGKVNQPLGAAMTAVLLLSSYTASRSRAAMANDNRRGFLQALAVTLVLGVLFLGGVAFEWATAEFTPTDAWGTAFFSITGLHAVHVISGVAVLALVARLGLRGRFSSQDCLGAEMATKYWTFVDAIWVFIYLSLYLLRPW